MLGQTRQNRAVRAAWAWAARVRGWAARQTLSKSQQTDSQNLTTKFSTRKSNILDLLRTTTACEEDFYSPAVGMKKPE